MLALVGDGHVGGGDPALTKCRSRPRVRHIDAPSLCRPYGEPHEHDGSKSKKKSDANLEDTELGEPEHFASPAERRLRRPRQVIPGCLSLLYAASEAVSCALVSRVALRRFAAS